MEQFKDEEKFNYNIKDKKGMVYGELESWIHHFIVCQPHSHKWPYCAPPGKYTFGNCLRNFPSSQTGNNN
jgi:hypothetical protein